MDTLLYIDCCIRGARTSRTEKVAHAFLDALEGRYRIERIPLADLNIQPLHASDLSYRDALIACNGYDSPIFDFARQFVAADRVLVAALYWDLSFPSLLKVYLERLMVNGLAFKYVDDQSVGLAHADKAVYITTAGGFIADGAFGSGYVQAVFEMLGIEGFSVVKAEGLDVVGNDVEALVSRACEDAVEAAQGF